MGGSGEAVLGTHGIGQRRFALTTTFSDTTIFYKFRGWYAPTLEYETWTSSNKDSTPPSGRTLADIAIVDQWIYTGRSY